MELYNIEAKGLVLASQSTTRAELLSAAGLVFQTAAPRVDEDAIKASLQAEGASPTDIAVILAKIKAERISAQFPLDLVIGADQILTLDDKIFSKASNIEAARDQLKTLRGHRHKLITGMVVALAGTEIWRNVDIATLTMRPFSDAFLDQYLVAMGDQVCTSVGGYHIEGVGTQLFSSVLGDWTTIKGLTVLPLVNFLREHGVVTE